MPRKRPFKKRKVGPKPKRSDWLAGEITKHNFRVGAEVGVRMGKNMCRYLKLCPYIKCVYAVDLWAPQYDHPKAGQDYSIDSYNMSNWAKVQRVFLQRVDKYGDKVKVLQGYSTKMAKAIPDASLDWVFIDADHTYDGVRADIRAWWPKVKPGCLLCGHDFGNPICPGVKPAVLAEVPDAKEAGVDWVWYYYV